MRIFAFSCRISIGLALWITGCESGIALRLEFRNGLHQSIGFNGNDVVDGVGTLLFRTSGLAIERSDGAGDSLYQSGLLQGQYRIGPITIEGEREFARVAGLGSLLLYDTFGYRLTATLEVNHVVTFVPVPSDPYRIGTLNADGAINVTAIRYDGPMRDFSELAAAGAGILTLDFRYSPNLSLTQMTRDGFGISASFSGSITSVPEPTALPLLGTGMLSFACWLWRRGQENRETGPLS